MPRPRRTPAARILRAVRLSIAVLLAAPLPFASAATVSVELDPAVPRTRFAADEILAAVRSRGHEEVDASATTDTPAAVRIVLTTRERLESIRRSPPLEADAASRLVPEGFAVRMAREGDRRTCWVVGADTAGAMYGGLEVAEVIRVADVDGLRAVDRSPYMAMRGTKFNIPLDVRTPSYTDVCDAAQRNIPEMWSFDFWRDYLDALARYRYNFVSLWSLHPFPSLVRVPDYPDVALADVQRSTVDWKENYSLNGLGFDAPEIIGNVEVLKRLSIEEKIRFWRRVMQHAHDRNIRFYVVTWNIFVNGTGGKYGITDSIENATTADYFRKSVLQMFREYPLLAGVGLTTGENMHGSGFGEKEDWAFRTYGQGVLDAAKEFPGRKLTLIHRQHQTGAKDIARRFAPLIEHPDIEFIFSFKYAKAHVYSSTRQPYHHRFVEDIAGMETIWTLRNDDIYHFRWGAPDFVREFLRNIPYEVSRGFYLGSDQYIWGREFRSTEPETPRQVEVVKHWYHWMLWGRLGYDPELSNERLAGILGARFPGASAEDLFAAWQEASMIYPCTTGFHWGALDFQWYIEACQSRPGPAKTPSGFHDVNRFITLKPNAGTDYVSIPDWVKAVAAGEEKELEGTSPVELARRIHDHADRAFRHLDRLEPGGDKELRLTLDDIRTIACLGKYYAHKIRGATELALHRRLERPAHREEAIRQLESAAGWWRRYASLALARYENPLWTNRVGYCDWREQMEHVLGDIREAGGTGAPRLESMEKTLGGRVLEAEAATITGARKLAAAEGATGEGCVELPGAPTGTRIEWTFDARRAGTYILELRYTLDAGRYPTRLTIDGEPVRGWTLWSTGGKDTWGWDRIPVRLDRGESSIRLEVSFPGRIDHLNILPAVTSPRTS